jgi:hypothetical protein
LGGFPHVVLITLNNIHVEEIFLEETMFAKVRNILVNNDFKNVNVNLVIYYNINNLKSQINPISKNVIPGV